jgi:TPR repeat protein
LKLIFRACIVALITCSSLGASAVSGPFEDGLDAARRADYETVLRLWRPLADQGDAKAQVALARLYVQGRGVVRDHAAAIRWYQKAAEQGDEEAQEALARLYAVGRRPALALLNTSGQNDRAESGGDHPRFARKQKIGGAAALAPPTPATAKSDVVAKQKPAAAPKRYEPPSLPARRKAVANPFYGDVKTNPPTGDE